MVGPMRSTPGRRVGGSSSTTAPTASAVARRESRATRARPHRRRVHPRSGRPLAGAIDGAYPALHRLREHGVMRAIGAGMNQSAMPPGSPARATSTSSSSPDATRCSTRTRYRSCCRCASSGVSRRRRWGHEQWRSGRPAAGTRFDYGPAGPDALGRARRLAAICVRHGASLRAAAVQFPLAHPAVAALVAGVRRVDPPRRLSGPHAPAHRRATCGPTCAPTASSRATPPTPGVITATSTPITTSGTRAGTVPVPDRRTGRDPPPIHAGGPPAAPGGDRRRAHDPRPDTERSRRDARVPRDRRRDVVHRGSRRLGGPHRSARGGHHRRTAPDAPGGELLVGIRHLVHDEPDPAWLARTDVRRGIAAVGAAGLAFDLLVRARELPAALTTVRALPDVRFVIDHLAKPPIASGTFQPWARLLGPFGAAPNVSCKVSGLVTEADWPAGGPESLAPYVAQRPRGLRAGTADVRVGLAGLPARRLVRGGGRRHEVGAGRVDDAETERVFGGTATNARTASSLSPQRVRQLGGEPAQVVDQGRHALGGRADLEQGDARRVWALARPAAGTMIP